MQWLDRIGLRLKPRDLYVFMAVVELGTMAKAAERLAISRPVVSKTIIDLERVLGVQLLDRTPNGIEPTLYGHTLLKRSVAVFDELRQTTKDIEFLAGPNAGELRIGCPEHLSAGLLSKVIDRFSRRYPNVLLKMEVGTSATLQSQSLRERKCELVIAQQFGSNAGSDIDVGPLFHDRHLIAAGPRSKWLGRRKVGLADLSEERWILTSLDLEPGAPLFEGYRAIGQEPPRPNIISPSLNLRNGLMPTGRFLTVIPASVLQFVPKHQLRRTLPIELPRWEMPVSVFRLKHRSLSRVAELFIDCVRETAKPLAKRR